MENLKRTFMQYFIPHEDNDYKPHILRARTVAFVCLVALIAESAFVFSAKFIIPRSKLFGIVAANALVDETNQSRTANGLPNLQMNPLLQAAAQAKANDMSTKGYFAHTSPQGLTPWYWFQQAGYNFDYAGENLAVNFSDSQDVTNAWLNSPEHRANIMSTNFTQIGIATAQGVFNGQLTTYVVEEFGTPATAPISFVDTASAATTPAKTPAPTPAKTTAAVKKPIALAPATKPVPVVVAVQSSSAPAAQQMFVAVKGEATQTVPVAATAPAVGITAAATPLPAQSNFFQRLLAAPKELANDFYLLVMVLFVIALMLNIFIKIRIQHPRLIMGGLLVIVVAGLCVMLNQDVGFLHAVIL